MQLPCNHDQGILGLKLSPSCNQFIIYACYDLPNYYDYYEFRAEIFGFNIAQGKGLETITPSFEFVTKDWSITDLVWIDDKRIALKVYIDGIPSGGNNFGYKYFKTNLK
jgi:hypothetical protein